MLAQVGRMVEINGHRIPAVNIQVENVPGFLTMENGSVEWYGVYFEIMFDDGSLWVVDQKTEQGADDTIYSVEYDRFGMTQDLDEPDYGRMFHDWEEFLNSYVVKVASLR